MNYDKFIHSFGLLLALNGNKMNYFKVVKLIYLAGKKEPSLWDKSINFNYYLSYSDGAILSPKSIRSHLQNTNEIVQGVLDQYFKQDGCELKISVKEPFENTVFSENEMKALFEVDKEYKDSSYLELLKVVHNSSVFLDNSNSKNLWVPLNVEDALGHIGYDDLDVLKIMDRIKNGISKSGQLRR